MSELLALIQVILIDVALSGDNAIVIAMAAAGLATHQRKRAIAIGIGAAIVMRVLFSLGAVWLMKFPVVLFIGGLMLLWVCWKMYQEITSEGEEKQLEGKKTMLAAVTQIAVADISMSIDNVLAVAGAASDHVYVMAFGLLLSIGLMAVAASYIVGLLNRWPWLKWCGLALILYVAGAMLWKSWPYIVQAYLEGGKLLYGF